MPSDVIEPVGDGHGPGHGDDLLRKLIRPEDLPQSSSSGDELYFKLIQARPDPLLGGDARTPPSHDVIPAAEGLPRAPGASVSSFDALRALDVSVAVTKRAPKAEPPVESEEDEPRATRGGSLAFVLLASYASAVTFGLAWVLWSGRRVKEVVEPDPKPPVDVRADPGLRADGSRRVLPPPALTASQVTTLGETIRLGQVEATPVEVTSGPVTLIRSFEGAKKKSAGEDALRLRIRLRNVSEDKVFAPLDEAFLRDRPRVDPDSFIEVSAGRAPIAQFPLAVESEWSIEGQEFRELRPGESYTTSIVSAPEALSRKAPEMTWRVRLRTDINHTDDLGVRFRDSDIKPAGPRRTTRNPR